MTTPTDDLIARLRGQAADWRFDDYKAAADLADAAAERLREQEAEIARLTVSESEARIKIAEQLIKMDHRTAPQEAPVAWMRVDDYDASISTMTVCISDRVRELWLKANPKQVERYTMPLYAARAQVNP